MEELRLVSERVGDDPEDRKGEEEDEPDPGGKLHREPRRPDPPGTGFAFRDPWGHVSRLAYPPAAAFMFTKICTSRSNAELISCACIVASWSSVKKIMSKK